MSTLKIERDRLPEFFADFTKRFLSDGSPETVDIEVFQPIWGGQRAVREVRLNGITYDRNTNSLEFALATGDHRVFEPDTVWVREESDGFLSAIEVIRPDGVREIVTLKRAATHAGH